jgi:hypothetical protein
MPRKLKPYTPAEIALATRLFAEAHASGSLKPGRGLAALALSNGLRRSVAQAPSYRDYLPDARKQLPG